MSNPRRAKPGRPRALYPAERRYMLDAARGLSAVRSAQLREVTHHTVNAERRNAIRALMARNITHAVALCMVYGEFTRDDITKD